MDAALKIQRKLRQQHMGVPVTASRMARRTRWQQQSMRDRGPDCDRCFATISAVRSRRAMSCGRNGCHPWAASRLANGVNCREG